MALNSSEILRQYEAAAKLVPTALERAAKTKAGAETFSEDLQQKISKREVSPEAVKREKETISQLFGTPASMEQELRAGGVLPTRAGQLIGGRMQTYLDQLDSIRDSRKSRQDRIDDIVKTAASGVKAQSEIAGLEADLLKDERDEKWQTYKEAQRQLEHRESLASAGTQTDRDRSTQSSIIAEYGQLMSKSVLSPDWDGGMNPSDYIKLVRRAENELGASGKDWFLDKFSPLEAITSTGNNLSTLEASGINLRDMASKASTSQLRAQMTDDLSKATSESDFIKIKDFYRDFTDLFTTSQEADRNKALFKDYMIDNLGSEEMANDLASKMFPLSTYSGNLINPNTGEKLEIK